MSIDDERHDMEQWLRELRARLEPGFSAETAVPGTAWHGAPPSTGHCAAVALIVQASVGGWLQSTIVDGVSHWFNRIEASGALFDVDITGDQFGRPCVQSKVAGELYPGSQTRTDGDVAPETLERALVLAERSRLTDIISMLRDHRAALQRATR